MNEPTQAIKAALAERAAQFVEHSLRGVLVRESRHQRAGITKNHGQPRNKRRAKMARVSRRRNRA